ncbi:MAG TPA: hypothetical protein PLX89_07095 [Verrucomicrobiota bacterium]|nr:hypothetical protein [Verrucomicrobiales bacterium]HRI12757.1 hypothetical protein [Verrucomicrobiota bacterium]
MKRPWLRRVAWGIAILLGLVLVTLAVALFNVNGITRRVIRTSLAQRTGVGVRLDSAELGIRDGSFRLQSLVISNPPSFGPDPLLALPELYVRYDPAAASSNVFRLAEARFNLAQVNVIVDRDGRTNLMELGRAMEGELGPDATNLLRGMTFGGVDRLTLTLGQIAFTDQRHPNRNLRYDLGITNRTLTNVTSLAQLLPLALEVAFRSGWSWGIPAIPNATNQAK